MQSDFNVTEIERIVRLDDIVIGQAADHISKQVDEIASAIGRDYVTIGEASGNCQHVLNLRTVDRVTNPFGE